VVSCCIASAMRRNSHVKKFVKICHDITAVKAYEMLLYCCERERVPRKSNLCHITFKNILHYQKLQQKKHVHRPRQTPGLTNVKIS